MKAIKINCEFTEQELEDIWSGLGFWLEYLNEKENPQTKKDAEKLIKKVKKYLGDKNQQTKGIT